ncbi:uncharacterized protein CIMG_07812 [Coccidioides immitis RS]|uniref:Uncharacterized protein n=1 Tax=Coccidioides immitis (strain RS) TaxID=246410 RepID=J3K465_COCIM|nr:uncharacterized protein CIMG_07812 [Coccidioides immitis RS]EAS29066.3 hypothetical protein CIMG_07812 [Coccidioides immitis RS]
MTAALTASHSVVGLIDLRGALRTGFATSRGEQTKHRGPLSSFKLQPRTGEGAAVPTDDNVRGCEPLPSPSPHHRCTDGVHGLLVAHPPLSLAVGSENAGTGTSGPSPPHVHPPRDPESRSISLRSCWSAGVQGLRRTRCGLSGKDVRGVSTPSSAALHGTTNRRQL